MLNDYNRVKLHQPLNNGLYIEQFYTKVTDDGRVRWLLEWKSNAASHICPHDGAFRKCNDCHYRPGQYEIECSMPRTFVSSEELCDRVNDCLNAELPVTFYGEGDDEYL